MFFFFDNIPVEKTPPGISPSVAWRPKYKPPLPTSEAQTDSIGGKNSS